MARIEHMLSQQLAAWDAPEVEHINVCDPFTLMDVIVSGCTSRGQYYANPNLLRRLAYWQDDWEKVTVQGWLDTLVEWGEVTIQPLAWNCYGGIHEVVTIQNMRRFRRFASRPPFTSVMRVAVYARDNGACCHCGATESLSIDHIYPWSKGGLHEMSNFQTLCRSCNSRKGART